MANYYSSPQINANPILPNATEIRVLSALTFTTGAINTAIVWDLHKFSKRRLYIEATGACTGGISAPITLSIQARPTNWPTWVTIMTPTITNTAYVFNINNTGIDANNTTSGGFSWMPIENLKIILTNPNTGTGGGATSATSVNTTINATLSLYE